jgi:hypothetical protein
VCEEGGPRKMTHFLRAAPYGAEAAGRRGLWVGGALLEATGCAVPKLQAGAEREAGLVAGVRLWGAGAGRGAASGLPARLLARHGCYRLQLSRGRVVERNWSWSCWVLASSVAPVSVAASAVGVAAGAAVRTAGRRGPRSP